MIDREKFIAEVRERTQREEGFNPTDAALNSHADVWIPIMEKDDADFQEALAEKFKGNPLGLISEGEPVIIHNMNAVTENFWIPDQELQASIATEKLNSLGISPEILNSDRPYSSLAEQMEDTDFDFEDGLDIDELMELENERFKCEIMRAIRKLRNKRAKQRRQRTGRRK